MDHSTTRVTRETASVHVNETLEERNVPGMKEIKRKEKLYFVRVSCSVLWLLLKGQ